MFKGVVRTTMGLAMLVSYISQLPCHSFENWLKIELELLNTARRSVFSCV